jgi:hypothetical protein
MNEKLNRHAEREKVESVVWTFLRRLSDIKPIGERREAAAILSLQLLDELSGVLFKGEMRERVQQFVETYMPDYSGRRIYDLFKNSLEYNYSTEESPDVSMNVMDISLEVVETQDIRLFPKFVHDLAEGVRKAVEEFRNDKTKWRQAVEWFDRHKVSLIPLSLYTEEQQFKIAGYYMSRIKSRIAFSGGSYNIGFNFNPFAENGHRINVCIDDLKMGKEVTRIPLDILVGLLRLKKIEEVLEESNPSQPEP